MPNTARALTLPTVHLNGTSRATLTADYEAAYTAVQAAVDALCAASPNGRDYYVSSDRQAFTHAIDEHQARLDRLVSVKRELETILIHLSNGAR